MNRWTPALREGLVSGTVASVVSMAPLLLAGRRENGHAAAPVNAISHWIWARRALKENHPSLRYTLTGYLVHHGASIFWATLHSRYWGNRPKSKEPLPAVAGAGVAAAIACLVDFQLTPDRLTPGFEHRLSRSSLAVVYVCFAVGLALGSMACKPRAIERRTTACPKPSGHRRVARNP